MVKKSKKTVVITGGSRGIGEVIAKGFADNGYKVIVGARVKPDFGAKYRKNIHYVETDVRFEEDHRRLIDEALRRSGHVDVYVNCAGFSGWRSLHKIDAPFLEEMIATNLIGLFWGCKSAARALKKGGVIINISSLAGKRGSANNSVYCASKFAVTGITQALSKELGPKGIRVNAVCPVYIKTKGLLQALKSQDSPAGRGDVNKYLKKFAADNAALKRLPTAVEVADMCLFLASSKASAVTGQSINVDCGVMPQ